MDTKKTRSFRQAAGLGVVAGMRSFTAPATISHIYSRHPSRNLAGTPFKFVQTVTASKILKVLAAAEFVGDKLPNAPNRTSVPGLSGRILFGAFAGAAVYKARDENALVGGLVGGLAALASTFGCFFLRRAISKRSFVPDAVTGTCEDALAIALSTMIAKRHNQ